MTRKQKYVILTVLILAATGPALYLLSRSRTFQCFGKIVYRLDTDKKVVALTFDDGPTERTDTILRILDRYHIKATFFLTGKEMLGHPQGVRVILAAGHGIGNHSYSHRRLMLMSPGEIRKEVDVTDSLILATGYKGRIYFRPPYCKKLFYLPYYLSRTNRITATWDVEPETGNMHDADAILQHVKDNVRPGSIILLHAMYWERNATLQALPHIIEWLQTNGYEFVVMN
ncbi:polysaccharide deacetylase family protein [Nemorincola caseinilytica]|uniref:Polysaccharide deacetylase family protein n=1 Tax=Nemorincola caseinilytica TaxID=2054315 RepID=A0ABP8N2N8_9BACT